jgi:hypothetical protein
MSTDTEGSLYLADTSHYQGRVVNATEIISAFIGTGQKGSSGDGIQATAAQVGYLEQLSFDTVTGIIYAAGSTYFVIRSVNLSGIMNIFAGKSGNSSYSRDGGPATAATFESVNGVAVSNNSVYIVSCNAAVVRVVTNGTINLYAGTPQSAGSSGDRGLATNAKLNCPDSIATDPFGNVYVTDYNNNRVRKVNTSGYISTFAGNGTETSSGDGGAATSASLSNPRGIASDSSGNIYVVETGAQRIRKISTDGIISTVVGNGTTGITINGTVAVNTELNVWVGLTFWQSLFHIE